MFAKLEKPKQTTVKGPETEKLSTQAGHVIMYYDKTMTESSKEAKVTVASWRSYRLRRKTGSTLSGETQAVMNGISALQWHRMMIGEYKGRILKGAEVVKNLPKHTAITDAKSVYDATAKHTNVSHE